MIMINFRCFYGNRVFFFLDIIKSVKSRNSPSPSRRLCQLLKFGLVELFRITTYRERFGLLNRHGTRLLRAVFDFVKNNIRESNDRVQDMYTTRYF